MVFEKHKRCMHFDGFYFFSQTSLQRQKSIRREKLYYANFFALYIMKRKDEVMGCLFINWKGRFTWQPKWGLAKSTFKLRFVLCENILTNQTEVTVKWIIHGYAACEEVGCKYLQRVYIDTIISSWCCLGDDVTIAPVNNFNKTCWWSCLYVMFPLTSAHMLLHTHGREGVAIPSIPPNSSL